MHHSCQICLCTSSRVLRHLRRVRTRTNGHSRASCDALFLLDTHLFSLSGARLTLPTRRSCPGMCPLCDLGTGLPLSPDARLGRVEPGTPASCSLPTRLAPRLDDDYYLITWCDHACLMMIDSVCLTSVCFLTSFRLPTFSPFCDFLLRPSLVRVSSRHIETTNSLFPSFNYCFDSGNAPIDQKR